MLLSYSVPKTNKMHLSKEKCPLQLKFLKLAILCSNKALVWESVKIIMSVYYDFFLSICIPERQSLKPCAALGSILLVKEAFFFQYFKDRDSTAPKRGSVFIGLMTTDGAIWSRYQRAVLMR